MKLFSKLVYHSSPHKFENFEDTIPEENVGTGEGAQVHGCGLYVQSDKELNIKRYKERLGNRFEVDFGNGWISSQDLALGIYGEKHPEEYDRIYYCWDLISHMWSDLRNEGIPINRIIEEGLEKFKEYMESWVDTSSKEWFEYAKFKGEEEPHYAELYMNSFKNDVKNYKDSIPLLKGIRCRNIIQYTIDMPDSFNVVESEELIINNPNLVKIFTDLIGYDPDIDDDLTFEEGIMRSNNPKTCAYLKEHGIDAMRYDGRKDGECYVIFNCNGLKIISKSA